MELQTLLMHATHQESEKSLYRIPSNSPDKQSVTKMMEGQTDKAENVSSPQKCFGEHKSYFYLKFDQNIMIGQYNYLLLMRGEHKTCNIKTYKVIGCNDLLDY